MFDKITDKIILTFLCISVVFSFIILLLAGVSMCIKHNITLPENEFICSKSHSEEYTRLYTVGKILIPIRDVREVCDEYKRKGQ